MNDKMMKCAVEGFKTAYRVNHTHTARLNDREVALGAVRAYEDMLRVLGYRDEQLQELKVLAMREE